MILFAGRNYGNDVDHTRALNIYSSIKQCKALRAESKKLKSSGKQTRLLCKETQDAVCATGGLLEWLESQRVPIAESAEAARAGLSHPEPHQAEIEMLKASNRLLKAKIKRLESSFNTLQGQHALLQQQSLQTVKQQLGEQKARIFQSRAKIFELVSKPVFNAANTPSKGRR